MTHRLFAALRRGRDHLLGAAASATAATVFVAVQLRVWSTSPGIPYTYGSDGFVYQLYLRTVLRGEWYYREPRLGFPFGLDHVDRPASDHLLLALGKVLGWFAGGDAGKVLNLEYIVSYPLEAVAGYVALRWIGVRRLSATGLAVLYATVPYHLDRGTLHLFYSLYFVVPLAVAVLVRQLTDRPAGRRSWAALATIVALPLTGIYFGVFFSAIAFVVGAWQLLLGPDRRAGRSTVALGALCLVVLVAALAPGILGGASPGEGYERLYVEAEVYGLRVDRLLLPGEHHRIEALRAPAERMRASSVAGPDATSYLGAVGAVGLVAAVAFGLRRARPDDEPWRADVAALGMLALVILVIAVPAGLGGVASALGFTQIRGWNRISIFLELVALGTVGLLADRVLGGVGRWARFALVGAVTLLGVVEQSYDIDPAAREQAIEAYNADHAFFTALEADLPPAAAVLQLPAVPYPENPPVFAMPDYDHLRGYFHTESLRFSYGGLRTRVPPWDAELSCRGADEVLAGAVVAGFDAIYLNLAGLGPAGPDAVGTLHALLGEPLERSRDGQLLVWDLTGLRAALEADPPDDLDSLRREVLEGVETEGLSLRPLAVSLGLPRSGTLAPCR